MAISSPYECAPIAEAVIGINFVTPLSQEDIDKVNNKFSSRYPQLQHLKNVSVAVQVPGDKKAKTRTKLNEEDGYRRSTSDQTELLVLWHSSLTVSQLAPYPGWDIFYDRFVRDWKIWKRVLGFREIERIGVRYINRIDIPFSDNTLRIEDYLNVYPEVPDIIDEMEGYAVQTLSSIKDIGCKVTMNSAAVPSPILDHRSFVIDQDIVKKDNPPQKDSDIYELLNKIRIKKNAIFEACINDRVREFFQK
jgi:uncharacterized protein (TIGR04255 family)